jgi:hypothetical protein
MGKKIVALLLGISILSASIIHVPNERRSIQSALDGASPGDTISVAPGVYYEHITWPEVNGISLISQKGPDSTVIDGDSTLEVISMEFNSLVIDSTTLISGFTIRNGWSWSGGSGGGITCVWAAPRIEGNILEHNHGAGWGGGIYCLRSPAIIRDNIIRNNWGSSGAGIGLNMYSDALIQDNTISNNESSYSGPGIYSYVSNPIIIGNQILDNIMTDHGYGGGICCLGHTSPVIENNTIQGNVAMGYGGGILCQCASGIPLIHNNIISENDAFNNPSYTAKGGGIWVDAQEAKFVNNEINNNFSQYMGGGVWITGGDSGQGIVIEANSIYNNHDLLDSDGLHICWETSATLSCNSFGGNGYALNATENMGVIIEATNNWWGDSSGPYHPLLNPLGQGDAVTDTVNFQPWLLYAPICGNLNNDPGITPADGYTLLNYLGNIGDIPCCMLANVNGNNGLTSADGYYLLNHLGDPISFPLNCQPCEF